MFFIFRVGKLRHCCRKFEWLVYDGCRLNFLDHTACENTFTAHISSDSKAAAVVDRQHFLQLKSHDFRSGNEGCIKTLHFEIFFCFGEKLWQRQGRTAVLPEQRAAALVVRPSSASLAAHAGGAGFGPAARGSPFPAPLPAGPRSGPVRCLRGRKRRYLKTGMVISVKETRLTLQGQT